MILQPTSIVSYNHLGNNDGMNLSAPQTFRSKEISKSNVVDDMVSSNAILYEPGEHPDHVVVIKVRQLIFHLVQSADIQLSKSLDFVLRLATPNCSMCRTLGTAREPWMSTPLRSSWAARTPSFCTTPARTRSSPHQSFLIWCSWLSSAPGFS